MPKSLAPSSSLLLFISCSDARFKCSTTSINAAPEVTATCSSSAVTTVVTLLGAAASKTASAACCSRRLAWLGGCVLCAVAQHSVVASSSSNTGSRRASPSVACVRRRCLDAILMGTILHTVVGVRCEVLVVQTNVLPRGAVIAV